jgi:anti-repressor protein
MERELRGSIPDLSDPHALRALLLAHAEREIVLEGRAREAEGALAVAAPKALALDRIADTTGLILVSDASKTLRMRPKVLIAWMLEHRWLFRRRGTGRLVGMQDKLNAGFLDGWPVPAGEGRSEVQVYVTPAGLTRLSVALGIAQGSLLLDFGSNARGRARQH